MAAGSLSCCDHSIPDTVTGVLLSMKTFSWKAERATFCGLQTVRPS